MIMINLTITAVIANLSFMEGDGPSLHTTRPNTKVLHSSVTCVIMSLKTEAIDPGMTNSFLSMTRYVSLVTTRMQCLELTDSGILLIIAPKDPSTQLHDDLKFLKWTVIDCVLVLFGYALRAWIFLSLSERALAFFRIYLFSVIQQEVGGFDHSLLFKSGAISNTAELWPNVTAACCDLPFIIATYQKLSGNPLAMKNCECFCYDFSEQSQCSEPMSSIAEQVKNMLSGRPHLTCSGSNIHLMACRASMTICYSLVTCFAISSIPHMLRSEMEVLGVGKRFIQFFDLIVSLGCYVAQPLQLAL